ncbi:MAG: DUF3309 family protein [Bdellovibrionota bacterium]
MNNIVVLILVLLLIGAFPVWPYSAHWGYGPGGGIGLLLMIVLVVALTRGRSSI